jgi:hypothetical protein
MKSVALAILLFGFASLAHARGDLMNMPGMSFETNTPGVQATLTIGAAQSAALTDFIRANRCIPIGSQNDGSLDLTVNISGVMYARASNAYVRLDFCNDAVAGAASKANISYEIATSAASGKMNQRNNLLLWASDGGPTLANDISYQKVGKELVSFIRMGQGSFPVNRGLVFIVNMENEYSIDTNYSNPLGVSTVRIKANP